MVSPFWVVCPKCKACKTVKCLEPIKDGSKFIDEFHQERIDLANQQPDDRVY